MAAATAAAGLMCAAAAKAPQGPFAMPKVTNAKVPGGVSMDPYVGAVSVDAGTGAILSADNPDRPGYPASTTKLMTLLLVLEDLQAKRYALDSRAVASKRAARQVASHIPLKEGQSMSVDDLLMALMVKSANDAAIVLAENSAGSVEAFVERMNERAAQLGMSRTRFCTPNGLSPTKADPHGFDVSTAHDLARLACAVVKHPEAFRYTSKAFCTITNGAGEQTTFRTHNPFLYDKSLKVRGLDGLKTGYTDKGGSSIVLTAMRGERRVVTVILGSMDKKTRERRAHEMITDAAASVSL